MNESSKADPTSPYPYSHLGILYSDLKQYSSALEKYKQAIKLKDLPAIYNLAILYFNNKHMDSASHYLTLYVNHQKNNTKEKQRATYLISYIPNFLRNPKIVPIRIADDTTLHKKLLEIDTLQSNINLAKRYQVVNNQAMAKKYFDKVIMKEKNNIEGIIAASEFYLTQKNNLQYAEGILKKALTDNYGDCKIAVSLNEFYIKAKRYDDAEKILLSCYEEQKSNVEVALALGTAYEKKGNLREAERIYTAIYYRARTNKNVLQKLYEFYLSNYQNRKAETYRLELEQLRQ